MKTKRRPVILTALASILMLGLILAACDSGLDESDISTPQVVVYRSVVGNDLYILTITEALQPARARAGEYIPKDRDTYVLDMIENWAANTDAEPTTVSNGVVAEVPLEGENPEGKIYELTDDNGTNIQVTVVNATATSSDGLTEEVQVMSALSGVIVPPENDGVAAAPINLPTGNETIPQALWDGWDITDISPTPQPEVTPPTGNDPVAVTSVTLSPTTLSLTVGDTRTLTATVRPANATIRTVSWSSSNTDVATVNSGVLTAVSDGTATITVTTTDGNKTATCAVTVSSSSGPGGPSGPSNVAVTGVSVAPTTLSLTVGATRTLNATVRPSNASNKAITWSSDNTTVATVSGGVVTAVSTGTATITVTTTDGGHTATCSVTVSATAGSDGKVPGNNLADKMSWLQNNAVRGGNYIIELNADDSTHPISIGSGERADFTIFLRGNGANRTISLLSSGGMFGLYNGVNLVLENITLQSYQNDFSLLVIASSGSSFVMNSGATIRGATMAGVHIAGGNFTMNAGSTITGCAGYGVWLEHGGAFTMNGGNISNNNNVGVWVDGINTANGTFTMNGGTISGNNNPGCPGGGVYVEGTFNMKGGSISGNTASSGGGVFVYMGTFTKTGGTIAGNMAEGDGKEVYATDGLITKSKDITAGPGDNLSFNGNSGASSGAWDS